MRRLLAVAAVATAALSAAPANANYTCVLNDTTLDVCVQVTECSDVCFIKPGVRFECYLGFTGERVCRIVRALSFETGPL